LHQFYVNIYKSFYLTLRFTIALLSDFKMFPDYKQSRSISRFTWGEWSMQQFEQLRVHETRTDEITFDISVHIDLRYKIRYTSGLFLISCVHAPIIKRISLVERERP